MSVCLVMLSSSSTPRPTPGIVSSSRRRSVPWSANSSASPARSTLSTRSWAVSSGDSARRASLPPPWRRPQVKLPALRRPSGELAILHFTDLHVGAHGHYWNSESTELGLPSFNRLGGLFGSLMRDLNVKGRPIGSGRGRPNGSGGRSSRVIGQRPSVRDVSACGSARAAGCGRSRHRGPGHGRLQELVRTNWDQTTEQLCLFVQEAGHRRTRERFLALYAG